MHYITFKARALYIVLACIKTVSQNTNTASFVINM